MMKKDNVLAMKSNDGRIHLFDENTEFMASFVKGHWVANHSFSWTDMDENFWNIDDSQEVNRLFEEARKNLNQPNEQESRSA